MDNAADSYERAWLAEKDFQIQMMEDILFDIRQVGWLEPHNSRIQKRIDEAREMTAKIRMERIQRHREENERRKLWLDDLIPEPDPSPSNESGPTPSAESTTRSWRTLFRRS